MKSLILSCLAAVSLASCAGGPEAQRGTVIGGLGGAAVGGIIGSQSGRGLEGAALGAGLGAIAGNAIGDSRDRRYYGGGYYDGRYYDRRSRYSSAPRGYYRGGAPYRYSSPYGYRRW